MIHTHRALIPSIHHQNIHSIHQINTLRTALSHLSCFKICTSWNKISTHIWYLIHQHSFELQNSLYIHTHRASFHIFTTQTFTPFTKLTHTYSIIILILFQNLHILEPDLHTIRHFIQHHSFELQNSLYIHTHRASFHLFTTKTFTPFTKLTHCVQHYLIYLVSRSAHLGTRSPPYMIPYSPAFIWITIFTIYSHS